MRLKVLEAEEEERGRGSSRTGSSCSGDARLWKTEEWEGRRGYGDYAWWWGHSKLNKKDMRRNPTRHAVKGLETKLYSSEGHGTET